MTTTVHEPAALRLKTLRKAAGLTQADMAGRMGFKTPSGYARWENPQIANKDFLPADKIAELLKILTPRGVSEIAIRELGFRDSGPIEHRPLSEAATDPDDSKAIVDVARLKKAFEIVHQIMSEDPEVKPDGISGTDLATLAFAVYDEASRAVTEPTNQARDLEIRKIATDVIRIAKMLRA